MGQGETCPLASPKGDGTYRSPSATHWGHTVLLPGSPWSSPKAPTLQTCQATWGMDGDGGCYSPPSPDAHPVASPAQGVTAHLPTRAGPSGEGKVCCRPDPAPFPMAEPLLSVSKLTNFLPTGLGPGFPGRFVPEVVPPPVIPLLLPPAHPMPLPPFIRSQNGLGWKRSPKTIQSNPVATGRDIFH